MEKEFLSQSAQRNERILSHIDDNESKARLLVMLGTQHNDIIRHSHHEQFILEKCMNVKIYYLALTLTLHS